MQHIDHKPCVGTNGLKVIAQLHACRGVINPTGIKRKKELPTPLLVPSGYGYISKRVFYAKPSKPSSMMNRHHSLNLQRLEVEEELPLSFSKSHLSLWNASLGMLQAWLFEMAEAAGPCLSGSGIRAVGHWKSWCNGSAGGTWWDNKAAHPVKCLSSSSFHQASVSSFVGCVELLNVFNEAPTLFFFSLTQM